MITLLVQYPHREHSRFDLDYYLGQHMPMMQGLMGEHLSGWSVHTGIPSGDGSPLAFGIVAELYFQTPEALGQAMALGAAQGMADVPNFTDIVPVMTVLRRIASSQEALATQGGVRADGVGAAGWSGVPEVSS